MSDGETSKGSEQEEPRAQGPGGKALVWDGGKGQGSLTHEGGVEIATPGQGEGVRLCQVGKNLCIACPAVVMQSKIALFWEWAAL